MIPKILFYFFLTTPLSRTMSAYNDNTFQAQRANEASASIKWAQNEWCRQRDLADNQGKMDFNLHYLHDKCVGIPLSMLFAFVQLLDGIYRQSPAGQSKIPTFQEFLGSFTDVTDGTSCGLFGSSVWWALLSAYGPKPSWTPSDLDFGFIGPKKLFSHGMKKYFTDHLGIDTSVSARYGLDILCIPYDPDLNQKVKHYGGGGYTPQGNPDTSFSVFIQDGYLWFSPWALWFIFGDLFSDENEPCPFDDDGHATELHRAFGLSSGELFDGPFFYYSMKNNADVSRIPRVGKIQRRFSNAIEVDYFHHYYRLLLDSDSDDEDETPGYQNIYFQRGVRLISFKGPSPSE